MLPRISSSPWLNEVVHGSVWWNMWSPRVVQSSGVPLFLVLYLIVPCTREWWPAFRSCARACLLCSPAVFVAAQCLRPATNKGQGKFHRLEVHAPMHKLGGSLRCLSVVLLRRQDHLADTIRLKRELEATMAERTAFLSKSLALETLVHEQWEKHTREKQNFEERLGTVEQQLQAPSEPPAAEETEALTSQVDAGRHRSRIFAGAGPVPPSDSTEVISGPSRWIVVLFWCRRRRRHTTHSLPTHRKQTLLITKAKTSNKATKTTNHAPATLFGVSETQHHIPQQQQAHWLPSSARPAQETLSQFLVDHAHVPLSTRSRKDFVKTKRALPPLSASNDHREQRIDSPQAPTHKHEAGHRPLRKTSVLFLFLDQITRECQNTEWRQSYERAGKQTRMVRLRKESPCVSIVGADLFDTPLLSFPEENRVMLIQGVCVNFDCEHLAAGGCGLCLGAHCPRTTAKQTPRPPLDKPISKKETNKKKQETRTNSQRMGGHDLNFYLRPKKVHGDNHDLTSPTATAQATRTNGAHHDDNTPLILSQPIED